MALDWSAFSQFEAFDCQRAGVKAAKLPGLELRVITMQLPNPVENSDSGRRQFADSFIEGFLPFVSSKDSVNAIETEAQMFNIERRRHCMARLTPSALRLAP
jgi:hypothetical protein